MRDRSSYIYDQSREKTVHYRLLGIGNNEKKSLSIANCNEMPLYSLHNFKIKIDMRYIADENGILNNYAIEPKLYMAEAPSAGQQRQYLLQGAIALLVLASVIWTAIAVS